MLTEKIIASIKTLIVFSFIFLVLSFKGFPQTNIVSQNFNTTDEGWSGSGWVRDHAVDAQFPGGDGDYWHTTPFGYNSNQSGLVTSGTMDFTGYGNLTLQVDVRYNTEDNYDGFNIEYSDDNGSTWNILGAVGEGTNWYNDSDVDAIGNNVDGWSDDNSSWQTASITLPSSLDENATVKFRFVFETDGLVEQDGVAFDNFTLIGYELSTMVNYNFDSNDDGWSGAGWIRDNSSFTGYTSNHWHTTPFNDYGNNTTSTLTSSTIDLSGSNNLQLEFDVRYNTENGYDGLKIEYSSDNGSSWNLLGDIGEGTNWYNDASVSALNSAGWTDDNSSWKTASIGLPSVLNNNATVKFRFVFATDVGVTDDGVAFDNFKIYEFVTAVPTSAKTWYAYSSSGNWNDATSWTLDGAANPLYVNSDNKIPSADDYVKIPSGKKITIQSTTNNLELVKLTVNGVLDLTSSSGHNFNVITGNGKILMQGSGGSDNFPAGTSTLFSDSELGGTVEVYGTGIDLDAARDFNNLIINLTSGSATMLADYNIRGDLTVSSGDFKINDNSNTTPLNITVNGDVFVESGATMSVGTANAVDASAASGYGNYHKYYHVFTANGDFTNQGSVRFTNQNAPDFDTRTSNGAVSLVFNGAQNNTLSCQGTTDLYYLVVNKGTDRTYSLTINATNKAYFSLFGDNNANIDNTDVENPEQRTALWIKAGTLILEGSVYIPTLTEGYNYYIGENASLVLNGTNVFVSSTAIPANNGIYPAVDFTGLSYAANSGSVDGVSDNGYGAVYIYGTIIINDGTFKTSRTVGLIYRAESNSNKLEINGGLVRTSQFHISDLADPTTAKMSYIQTGGELQLIQNTRDAAIFDLSAEMGSFIMSGGTISIQDISNNGSPNAIEIACAENNINVSGGTIIIDNPNDNGKAATISSTAPLYNLILRDNQGDGMQLISDLTIVNDLTIEADDFDANGHTLYIGSDFTIEDGATFTSNSNTTVFNGTKLTNLSFTNTAPAFYNLTVAKTVDEKDFKITHSTDSPAFTVSGEFRQEHGDFDYGAYNVQLNGNLYFEDSVGLTDNTGYIQLNGSGLQTITSNGAVVKTMNITNSNGVSLSGDLIIYDTLTLTDAVFDINTYKLTMAGADAAIIAGTGFAADEMIMTDGNASDGGLEMYLDDNETLTFPMGTDSNNGGSSPTRYTPAVATFSSFSDDGYVRISLADTEIPMTEGNGGDRLSYYWRVRNSAFTTLPVVTSYVFTHDASDEDGGNVNPFVCGKVLDESPYTQSTENNYNKTANTITFNAGFDLELASYSAGNPSKFGGAPDVYYSRQSGNFNTASTWSKNDDTGNGTQEVPVTGSVVVIQNSNRVNVYAVINDLGVLRFDHDYTTYPTPNSENVPRLQFHVAGTYNLGAVSGTGMISFDASVNPIVNGDFGEFGTNTDSYYLYFGGNATLNNISTPIPNLMVESYTYAIDQDVDINGSFIVQGNGVAIPQQDMDIAGDLLIGYWQGGTFQFPSQADAITVTVDGKIDFTSDPFGDLQDRDLIVEHASSQNVNHKLILKGSIIHGTENGHSIDLWNSNTLERVTLELQGESNNTYSRTSTSEPELYRIIVNKGTDQTNSFSFNNSFSLNGITNGTADKALELLNGTFVLNDASTTIDLTTGNPFSIPSTAALEVTQGIVQASGNDGGITLDGSLTINGGTLDMSIADEDDANYIEYGASGNAKIDISSGTLNVGTQIRRLSSNASGVLNYTQTGGTVVIGVNIDDDGYDENRGMLEVLNSGSNFTFTGGSLTIVRQNGATPNIAAVYLDPSTYDVTGSTLTIGNDDTPTAQNDIKIYSTIDLNNLTLYTPALADYPNVKLYSVDLTLNGNLWINSNATLDGNGNDLTIAGNMTNNGSYVASSNNLIFNSDAAQELSGTGTEEIYQLTKNGAGSLTLSKNININNDLYLYNGTINTDDYAIYAEGNATLDGTISSTSGYGLVLTGELEQELSRSSNGMSTIGILTIDNDEGIVMNNQNHSLYITNKLRLENGVLNIGGSLLELGTNATIEEVEAFGLDNMIQTNSSFQDNGIKKNFPIGSTTDFVFPVGQLTYSPITVNLSTAAYTSGTTAGGLTVRPANEYHPTITSDGDYFASGDVNNVLQYYWILRADNFTGFAADVSFIYDDSDIKADEGGYSEADYIAARILNNNNPSGAINKYSIDEVDEVTNTITFHFGGANDDGIAGDYFGGIDEAIPDNVATYTTNLSGGTGNVTEDATYIESLPTPGTAPSGAILNVSAGDEVIFNVDDVILYKTIINEGGTLIINETERHRLGVVTGTGNLKIVSNSSDVAFPAGDFTDFFDCTGGGLEYAGTGSYTILGSTSSLRNLVVSGSGTKTMANTDVEICEDFYLNGPTFDNASNKNLTVNEDMFITSGTFQSGVSNTISVVGTVTVNGGIYNGDAGGTDSFGALTISSGSFNTGSGGIISIKGNLTYSGGTFDGGSGTATITLNGSSTQTVTGTFTGASAFNNFQINNSSGATLAGNVTIDKQLQLTAGLISPQANTLLISDGATVSPTDGSSASYVNGKLNKVIGPVDNSFVFPIGKSGQYKPTTVSNISTSGLTWNTEYFAVNATNHVDVDNNTPASGSGIATVSEKEYWVIEDGGSSTATIGLSWSAFSKVSSDATEREQMEVMVWNDTDGDWDNYGGGNFSSGNTETFGTFESTSAIQFSSNIITLGSSSSTNPLPVELLSFVAKVNNSDIELFWSTASENNNDYFEIQRSIDYGQTYLPIGNVYGNGNTQVQNYYSFTDEYPNFGTSYYRLKQVDYNGKYEYLDPISVNFDGFDTNGTDFTLYPNPYNSGNLILNLLNYEPNTSIHIKVIGLNGQELFSKALLVPNNQRVNLVPMALDVLPQGLYLVSVITQQGASICKLIVN